MTRLDHCASSDIRQPNHQMRCYSISMELCESTNKAKYNSTKHFNTKKYLRKQTSNRSKAYAHQNKIACMQKPTTKTFSHQTQKGKFVRALHKLIIRIVRMHDHQQLKMPTMRKISKDCVSVKDEQYIYASPCDLCVIWMLLLLRTVDTNTVVQFLATHTFITFKSTTNDRKTHRIFIGYKFGHEPVFFFSLQKINA